ncbi:hypothetical protein Y900_013025 [Mycolicibacterium aromaticivorans JS19b1 = JCM 16368]|uniref:HTH tetR-type domain-containing protein n=1 Tax=Mycolicibacterium aromaticivorans JS19b1 = JCM 16368 TaxID=1440774 RepID=A0A064CM26_9MYCO|nr:TetR/AcrR family transcriptional regulator [Mycolicibacterium aromaticivorans]KDE99832.1 hypothetical protein Y900_013025 [Mycolicibacterium aromaticivorans JS19b1 = JCM 16368]
MVPHDPEPQTRAERVRQTRARIVSVALTLFAEKGYEATSLQDIANEMGLTKPAVFYHYRGKQEILKDLAEPARTALSALLDRARAHPLGPERTEILVAGLADLFLSRREFARIMAQQAAFREAMRTAVGGPGMLDTLIEVTYGPDPSLDQRFAVYSATSVGPALSALGDHPQHELRAVLLRAFRRIAGVQ